MGQVDAVLIGAGVIGLAIAQAMAQRGLETVLLEHGEVIGAETNSPKGDVMHARHYPAGSPKAFSCMHFRDLLHAHCSMRSVRHPTVALRQGSYLSLPITQGSGLVSNGWRSMQPKWPDALRLLAL